MMNRFQKPTTQFVGRVIRGCAFRNGTLTILLDNDKEIEVDSTCGIDVKVVSYYDTHVDRTKVIEDGFCEGDY